VLPKKVSRVVFTADSSHVIAGDKFGAVYAVATSGTLAAEALKDFYDHGVY
jgi:hypothetical protein